ncbi:hypothetical protein ACFO0M_07800 [Micromonospora mangrovi]|uniref:Ig-like domain-containing protein n=2 Tax=Micromonospora TaxID=1873 RepID=A0AAU8HC61_9ACTN
MAAGVMVVGGLMVVGLAGCGGPKPAAGPERAVPVPAGVSSAPVTTADPPPVEIRCDRAGATVSATTVRATRAGVRVRVTGDAPADTYLALQWRGGGNGRPVPSTAEVWTLQAPPGAVRVSCSNAENVTAALTVVDPSGHWRPGTVADQGCSFAGLADWVVRPGAGSTVDAALADLTGHFTELTGRRTAWTELPLGYPDAPDSTWLLSVDGTARLTAVVHRSGSGVTASPDATCVRPGRT